MKETVSFYANLIFDSSHLCHVTSYYHHFDHKDFLIRLPQLIYDSPDTIISAYAIPAPLNVSSSGNTQ